ncbi:hypothetical protein HQ533_05615 [Candidatus Woesearchaeota archaeon]|nr:hypothetical protein [Candidatus Woesearchaeota archaeon]
MEQPLEEEIKPKKKSRWKAFTLTTLITASALLYTGDKLEVAQRVDRVYERAKNTVIYAVSGNLPEKPYTSVSTPKSSNDTTAVYTSPQTEDTTQVENKPSFDEWLNKQ